MLYKLTKLNTAKNRILKNIQPSNKKTKILLNEANQRFNYSTLKSNLNLPETLNSAVDGYGILYKSFLKNPKIKFKVVALVKAGKPYPKKIMAQEAVEIYTGSILPKGVDSVVMFENCERTGSELLIKEEIKKYQNVRPIGENIKKGEIIIKKGDFLNPSYIGQLAASGNNEIEVFNKLKVAIISTGNEVVNLTGQKKSYGQIYDSNRPMLRSIFNENYLEILDMGIVKDTKNALVNKYLKCLSKCDVVISSGGASEGIEDHTQSALKHIGAESLVWQLAIKPGKPMGVSILGKKLIFCLPGNPVAAFVCSKFLIKPALVKMAGGNNFTPFFLKITSGFEHTKKIGRTEFLRARINNSGCQSVILLHGREGSGVISSLTGADGLVEIPYNKKNVLKGELLKFYPFENKGI